MLFDSGRRSAGGRFNIVKFLVYIKDEIVLVLAVSSSEPALPSLMEKMERLGCSKALVGLVVRTGYTFNTDGTSVYMTLAALFVAQATNTHLSLTQATDHHGCRRAHLEGSKACTVRRSLIWWVL